MRAFINKKVLHSLLMNEKVQQVTRSKPCTHLSFENGSKCLKCITCWLTWVETGVQNY